MVPVNRIASGDGGIEATKGRRSRWPRSGETSARTFWWKVPFARRVRACVSRRGWCELRDQIQIWSDSHDSEPGNVIEFQRELSVAIAQQIHLHLSPERLRGLARRQTQHGEAYDVYLRGRYFWNQLSPLTTRRALQFYLRATELDPNYALAWCGLADAYATSPINGDANLLEVGPRARDAAARAVSAGSHLAEAHSSTGFVKFWLDWDWPAAERAFRRAIALDPNYSLAQRTLGIILSHSNRHQEALSAVRRARELDPLDFINQALSAQIAFNARDFQAAVEFGRRATVLDPEFWVSYIQLAQAYEQLGDDVAAFDALQKAGQFSSGNSKSIAMRGYLFAKLGRTGEAREVLKTLEAVSLERYVPPYATALVHAGLGEADAAFEWLERALNARDVHLVFLPVDPKWDLLRTDAVSCDHRSRRFWRHRRVISDTRVSGKYCLADDTSGIVYTRTSPTISTHCDAAFAPFSSSSATPLLVGRT